MLVIDTFLIEKRRVYMDMIAFRAVRHGHVEVVTVLLDSGADIDPEDDEGITPFVLSVKLNYLKMARYLWEKGAKVAVKDFKLKTALHHAVERKNLNIVKFIVEISKKSVHAKDISCHTPVHYAAREDSLEVPLSVSLHPVAWPRRVVGADAPPTFLQDSSWDFFKTDEKTKGVG